MKSLNIKKVLKSYLRKFDFMHVFSDKKCADIKLPYYTNNEFFSKVKQSDYAYYFKRNNFSVDDKHHNTRYSCVYFNDELISLNYNTYDSDNTAKEIFAEMTCEGNNNNIYKSDDKSCQVNVIIRQGCFSGYIILNFDTILIIEDFEFLENDEQPNLTWANYFLKNMEYDIAF